MQCQTVIQKVTFVRFIKIPLFLKFSLPNDGRRNNKKKRKGKIKENQVKKRNGTFRSHVNGKGEKKSLCSQL